jgi:sulfur carrier protein
MTATDISVTINELAFTLPVNATLMDAVVQFGVKPPFAAAVNLQFVPNSRYHQTPLHNADRIDLIAPVTGG